MVYRGQAALACELERGPGRAKRLDMRKITRTQTIRVRMRRKKIKRLRPFVTETVTKSVPVRVKTVEYRR